MTGSIKGLGAMEFRERITPTAKKARRLTPVFLSTDNRIRPGLTIKNTNSFTVYVVVSSDEKTNEIMLYNHEKDETKPFVLSRVLRGLVTGAFCEFHKEK